MLVSFIDSELGHVTAVINESKSGSRLGRPNSWTPVDAVRVSS